MIQPGLTPTYYTITFLGYISIIIVYSIFLRDNLKTNNYWVIFGSMLILYGYATLTYEYYQEWEIAINEEKRLHIDQRYKKGQNLEQAQQQEFQLVEFELVKKHFFQGHFILFLFHALSFIIPINMHVKTSNITAMLGHFMIYTNKYLTFGYFLMLIYYILYFIRNYHESPKRFVNKLQLSAAVLIMYRYLQNIIYMLTR